jgi:hypothetical protein
MNEGWRRRGKKVRAKRARGSGGFPQKPRLKRRTPRTPDSLCSSLLHLRMSTFITFFPGVPAPRTPVAGILPLSKPFLTCLQRVRRIISIISYRNLQLCGYVNISRSSLRMVFFLGGQPPEFAQLGTSYVLIKTLEAYKIYSSNTSVLKVCLLCH